MVNKDACVVLSQHVLVCGCVSCSYEAVYLCCLYYSGRSLLLKQTHIVGVIPELHTTQQHENAQPLNNVPNIYILVNFKFVLGNCYVNTGLESFLYLIGTTG